MTKRATRRSGGRKPVLSSAAARKKISEHDELRRVVLGNGGDGLRQLAKESAAQLGRLMDVVDGNASLDIRGVRPRLADLETASDEMKPLVALIPAVKKKVDGLYEDRKKVKWIAVGIGITGVANVGLLATVVKVVFFP